MRGWQSRNQKGLSACTKQTWSHPVSFEFWMWLAFVWTSLQPSTSVSNFVQVSVAKLRRLARSLGHGALTCSPRSLAVRKGGSCCFDARGTHRVVSWLKMSLDTWIFVLNLWPWYFAYSSFMTDGHFTKIYQHVQPLSRLHCCDYICQVADADGTCNGISWQRVGAQTK